MCNSVLNPNVGTSYSEYKIHCKEFFNNVFKPLKEFITGNPLEITMKYV